MTPPISRVFKALTALTALARVVGARSGVSKYYFSASDQKALKAALSDLGGIDVLAYLEGTMVPPAPPPAVHNPPSPPLLGTATQVNGTVTVPIATQSQADVGGNIVGYEVSMRTDGAGSFAVRTDLGIVPRTSVIEARPTGHTYEYQMRALDTFGLYSQPSNIASIVVPVPGVGPDVTKPATPAQPSVVSVSDNTWTVTTPAVADVDPGSGAPVTGVKSYNAYDFGVLVSNTPAPAGGAASPEVMYNIGSPGVTGVDNGARMTGGGNSHHGTADQFCLIAAPCSGDLTDMHMKLDALAVSQYGAGGLEIRDTIDPASPFININFYTDGGNHIILVMKRATAGAVATEVFSLSVTLPVNIKLTNVGGSQTAQYEVTPGVSGYVTAHTAALALGATYQAGRDVCAKYADPGDTVQMDYTQFSRSSSSNVVVTGSGVPGSNHSIQISALDGANPPNESLLSTARALSLTGSAGGGGSGGQTFSGQFFQALREPGTNGWLTTLNISPHNANELRVGGDLFGGGWSSNGGAHWHPVQGLLAQFAERYTWHPNPANANTVWVASLSGPYLSTDGGKTVVSKRGGLPAATNLPPTDPNSPRNITAPFSVILYDPSDATNQTVIGFSGSHRGDVDDYPFQSDEPTYNYYNGRVWRFNFATDSWVQIGIMPHACCVHTAVAAADGTLYAAARFGPIFKSTDHGVTWAQCIFGKIGGLSCWIVAHPTLPGTLWATDAAGTIYRTTNGGADNWPIVRTSIGGGLISYSPVISVFKQNPQVLFACTPGAVIMSQDGGTSWSTVMDGSLSVSRIPLGSAYPIAVNPEYLECDPTDAGGNKCYIFIGSAILYTANRGATWTDKSSTPVGANWRGNGYQGAVTNAVKWNPFRLSQMFLLAGDLKAVRSEDYTYSWFAKAMGPASMFNGANDVACSADGVIYIGTGQNGDSDLDPNGSGRRALLKNTNWGLDGYWSYVLFPVGVQGQTNAVYTLPGDSTKVWAGVGGTLYYSPDGGANWNPVATILGNVFCIVADPNVASGLTFYVGTYYQGVLKTTDGQAFTAMAGSPKSGSGVKIAIDPVNSNVLYVAQMNASGLWKYTGTWNLIYASAVVQAVAIDPGNNQRLAVATADWPSQDITRAIGVLLCSNATAATPTFTPIDTGLQIKSCTCIGFHPDKSAQLIVGLGGGGWFATDLGNSTMKGGGAPAAINAGAILQAEDFDDGGADNAYRIAGGGAPSVIAGDGGTVVDSVPANSYLKYQRNILAGTYTLAFRAKSVSGGARVHVKVNGVNVTGSIALTVGAYGTVVVPGVDLDGGIQYIQLYFESGVGSVNNLSFS